MPLKYNYGPVYFDGENRTSLPTVLTPYKALVLSMDLTVVFLMQEKPAE
ncbi:MAG: hypothetical protein IPL55_05405 [Saprospiraceae bacterium]|jgi:hypothetical protein|nr:hypothetical protein [Saprospiraceae bacterium]